MAIVGSWGQLGYLNHENLSLVEPFRIYACGTPFRSTVVHCYQLDENNAPSSTNVALRLLLLQLPVFLAHTRLDYLAFLKSCSRKVQRHRVLVIHI